MLGRKLIKTLNWLTGKKLSVEISFVREHSSHILETFLDVYALIYNESSVSVSEEP